MPWFIKNRDTHNLSAYAGVVGVDHYWTGQGVPCVNGDPHEFGAQDSLATEWKTHFPGGMRCVNCKPPVFLHSTLPLPPLARSLSLRTPHTTSSPHTAGFYRTGSSPPCLTTSSSETKSCHRRTTSLGGSTRRTRQPRVTTRCATTTFRLVSTTPVESTTR
jgi:hypothetical protein